jgi:hypothetical protein
MLKQKIFEHLSQSDEFSSSSADAKLQLSPSMQRLMKIPTLNDEVADGDGKPDAARNQELENSKHLEFYNLQTDDMLMLLISDSAIPPECIVLDRRSIYKNSTLLAISPSIFEARSDGEYRFATSSTALPSDRISTWSAVFSSRNSKGYANLGVCGTFETRICFDTDRNDGCGSYYAFKTDTCSAFIFAGSFSTLYLDNSMVNKSGDAYVLRFIPASVATLHPTYTPSTNPAHEAKHFGGDFLIKNVRTGSHAWIRVMHSPVYITLQLSGNHRIELRPSTAEELASVPDHRGADLYHENVGVKMSY